MNTRLIISSLAFASTLFVGACSDDKEGTTDTTPPTEAVTDSTAQLPAPIFVDPATADGTTVEVPVGNVVVITVDEPTAWTATIADPAVATFTAGGTDGTAEFNPGLTPLQAGTTEVTITDGTVTVTFTLTVTA